MKYAVAYRSGSIWNVVYFPSKSEAAAWAARYCANTFHRVGLATSNLCH